MIKNPVKEEEFVQNFYDDSVSRLAEDERISPSAGITRHVGGAPKTFSGAFSKLQALQREHIMENGPSARDGKNAQPGNRYRDRLYDFIRQREGERLEVYKDHKGNRTVGLGFNMDSPEARELWERSLPGVDFDDIREGKDRLLPTQSRALFDNIVPEYEEIVRNKIGKDVYIPEHQMIALTSLAYNAPSLIGPRLTEFVRQGETKLAAEEILNRSNKENHRGIQNRRDIEAQQFFGNTEEFKLAFNDRFGDEVLVGGTGSDMLSNYEVQRGDSLSKIAQQFNTTVEDLVNLNDIKNPDKIHVGQSLVIDMITEQVPAMGSITREYTDEKLSHKFSVSLEAETTNRQAYRLPVPRRKPKAPESEELKVEGSSLADVVPRRKPKAPESEEPKVEGSLLADIVPSHIRGYMSHILGFDLDDVRGADYFNSNEQTYIKDVAFRAAERQGIDVSAGPTKWAGVSYTKDYTNGTKDVDPSSFKLIGDSKFSVKATLGDFAWRIDERGHLVVRDVYNFNDAKKLQKKFPTFLDKVAHISEIAGQVLTSSGAVGPYAVVRRAGALFGATEEGAGAKFEIDLGPITGEQEETETTDDNTGFDTDTAA